MFIVKTKRQQEYLKPLGYKPEKRLQCCKTYVKRENYFKNIKEKFGDMQFTIGIFLISPFVIIYKIYEVLRSLMWWMLVYTKKNLSEGGIVTEAKFKKTESI